MSLVHTLYAFKILIYRVSVIPHYTEIIIPKSYLINLTSICIIN